MALRIAFLLAVPIGCFLWGLVEAKLYTVKVHTLPVLAHGSVPLTALQISDLHLRRSNRKLAAFLESLSASSYDFVFATGDLLGEPGIVNTCARVLNSIEGRHGRFFVLGSSDYYAPRFKNYIDYFLGRRRHGTRKNPTDSFKSLLVGEGWQDLSNRNFITAIGDTLCQFTGLDDPYLNRDDRSLLRRDDRASVSVCIVHDPAPYQDAAATGYDLTISGHTHGGQVRFPFIGAVVTNTTVPRRLARWASKVNGGWLFVSPGLGTGRYAPFRFLCRPEASLLRLVPKQN